MKKTNETSASSLGLGAALAVAYDLPDDHIFSQTSYVHPETTSVPLTSVPISAQPTAVYVLSKNGYYTPVTSQGQALGYPVGEPYWAGSGYIQSQPLQHHMPVTTAGVPMTAYLNPIPVSSPSPARIPDTGTYFLPQQQPPPPSAQHPSERLSYLEVGPASESTMSTDSMLSIRSDSTAPNNYQPAEVGYTIKPVAPHPIMPNPATHHVATKNNHSSSSNSSSSLSMPTSNSSRRHDDQRQAAVPPTGSDDGLYELSEEDVKKIDDMLTQNPQVTSSRHWKYYVETNEWTRATCALMACLFSRDQMANSTVLGRGGSQRERLPTNLVAYVVTKMRRRFNRSAAAVRARMAQKCKDERRFGRVLPSGVIATNTDRSQPAAATSSMRHSVAASRRRSAATTASSSSNGDFRASSTVAAKSPRLSTAECYATANSSLRSPPPQLHQTQSAVGTAAAAAAASLVHDPPVILASGHEMTS